MKIHQRGKRSALVLASLAALSVQAMAEDPASTAPEAGLSTEGMSTVQELFDDKKVSYTWTFGTGDAEGALRVYAEVKKTKSKKPAEKMAEDLIQAQSTDPQKIEKAPKPKKKRKLQAGTGIEAEAFLFDRCYKVAAIRLETKAETEKKAQTNEPAPHGRNRSNAVASRQESTSRSTPSRSSNSGSSRKSRAKSVLKNNLKLEIAGFTVKYKPDPKQEDMAPRNLIPTDLSTYVVLGPVPVNIRGNGGVGTNVDYAPSLDLEALSLGVNAEASAYLHGWVSAGLGGGVAGMQIGAGVMATLNMMKTTVGAEMGASPEGLGGKLTLGLEAVAIDLLAFVKAKFKLGWFEVSKFWSYTLASFSSGVTTREWPLLGATP